MASLRMKDLTKRQKEVLDIIERTVRSKGYPPSMREITAQLHLASAAGIHKHIKALVRKGFLSKENYLSRSLRIVRDEAPLSDPTQADLQDVPLVGTIAAGQPIEAIEQQQETLALPAAMLGAAGIRHFLLRVRGDSMVEEGILDGDYVVVESRETAHNGEVVVALVHGQEATLKRFYREDDHVRLQPANASMAPILLPGADVRIQGVVVGIWRRF
ncbi:MAG TPA: transcriptional repressor LexA [bacterium]|nr:transcriptional repressor LexA [bacterium]